MFFIKLTLLSQSNITLIVLWSKTITDILIIRRMISFLFLISLYWTFWKNLIDRWLIEKSDSFFVSQTWMKIIKSINFLNWKSRFHLIKTWNCCNRWLDNQTSYKVNNYRFLLFILSIDRIFIEVEMILALDFIVFEFSFWRVNKREDFSLHFNFRDFLYLLFVLLQI